MARCCAIQPPSSTDSKTLAGSASPEHLLSALLDNKAGEEGRSAEHMLGATAHFARMSGQYAYGLSWFDARGHAPECAGWRTRHRRTLGAGPSYRHRPRTR